MYLMAGLLIVGFICNFLVRPVDARHHYSEPKAEAIPDYQSQRATA
jgi:hypothetical protein